MLANPFQCTKAAKRSKAIQPANPDKQGLTVKQWCLLLSLCLVCLGQLARCSSGSPALLVHETDPQSSCQRRNAQGSSEATLPPADAMLACQIIGEMS